MSARATKQEANGVLRMQNFLKGAGDFRQGLRRWNNPQRRSLRYRRNWVSLFVKATREMCARKIRRELCLIWN